jgi:chromosome segregation ATPase
MRKYIALLLGGLLALGAVGLAQNEGAASGDITLPPVEDEVTAMQTAFGQVTDFLSNFIQEFKWTVSQVNQRFATVNASFTDLASRVGGLAKDLNALGARMGGAESRISSLESACGDLSQKLDAAVSDLNGKISSLSSRLASDEALISKLGDSFNSLAGQLDALSGKLASFHDEYAAGMNAVSGKLDDLGGQIAELGTKLDDHEARIAKLEEADLGSLQRRVLALEQALQALQAKIENNRAKIEGVEKALGTIQDQIAQVKSDMDGLKGQVASEVGDQLAAMQQEIDQMKEAQGGLWTATIVIPALVGALVYFLVTSSGS